MNPEDARTETVTIRLSPREVAELDRHGGTRSGTAREALLEWMEFQDTARRPAARRPNYKRKREDEGR